MTSSMGLEANDDRPIAVPRAAAARATATSPSGWTACTPVGEISTGSETSWPITLVAISRVAGRPATCGAKPSSENAATLSRIVTPASAPAINAPYTSFGRCRLARRWATATVSNHLFAINLIISYSPPPALASEELTERRGHVPVGPDRPEQAAAEPREVAGQLRVLLAGRVKQYVEPGQPRGEGPRVGAGVVHAVGKQQHPRVPGGDPAEFAPRHLQRERHVGEPARRYPQHRFKQPFRRNVLPEAGKHRRVGPERDHREVVPGQFRRERADRGRRGPDPLAAHGPGQVHQQHHGTGGGDPLAHHDVFVLGHRVLGELLERPVQVD